MGSKVKTETVALGNGLEFKSQPYYSPAVDITRKAPLPGQIFDVADATGQNIEAFKDLGLVPDEGAASEEIAAQMIRLHDVLSQDPSAIANAEVLPFIGVEVDDGDFTFEALAKRFELGRDQSLSNKANVWIKESWGPYKADNINRRTLAGKESYSPAARSYPLAMLLSREFGGVWFSGKRVSALPQIVEDDVKHFEARHPSFSLRLANPVDYIVVNAIRRVRGENLLDKGFLLGSRTLFLATPSVSVRYVDEGTPFYETPKAKSAFSKTLVFDTLTSSSPIKGTEGVRRVLGLAQETSSED